MPKLLIIYPLWLMVLLVSNIHAETDSPESFISLQLENDAFSLTGDSSDHYYTHGTLLSILSIEAPPKWLGNIIEWTPFNQNSGDLDLVQYTVGHKVFTPNNKDSFAVVVNDRPYGGYLYFGISTLSHTRHSKNVDYGDLFEITFGLVGPNALGEQSQNLVHEGLNLKTSNGWDNQLKNELALGLSYSRLWRMVVPVTNTLMVGINRHNSMALGNVYTYAASGVMFRIGNHLKHDLNPPTIRPGFPGLPYFQAVKEPSWYFYLGFEGRLMLRDIFLDGNTFTKSHSVEKYLLVGDVQHGFVYMFGDIRIAFSRMYRTKEFISQEEKDYYGEINLSLRY